MAGSEVLVFPLYRMSGASFGFSMRFFGGKTMFPTTQNSSTLCIWGQGVWKGCQNSPHPLALAANCNAKSALGLLKPTYWFSHYSGCGRFCASYSANCKGIFKWIPSLERPLKHLSGPLKLIKMASQMIELKRLKCRPCFTAYRLQQLVKILKI